jgi:hypothetical protein
MRFFSSPRETRGMSRIPRKCGTDIHQHGRRPQEAGRILLDLAASDDDEEIAVAADEAIVIAEGSSDEADYEEDASRDC